MFWEGYRQFIVKEVREESESAKSFFLTPADEEPLAEYLPGQHLPIRVAISGSRVSRCYTLSDCFNPQHYRLTIKRERSSVNGTVHHGLVSNHFHDHVSPGATIEAKLPSGNFYLDPAAQHPVVLLAGGIGVTPMISMINSVAAAETSRDIYFFFALRDHRDHAFRRHLQQLAAQHPNIRMTVFYESLLGGEIYGVDFHEQGRITLSRLRERLPGLDMEFYLCGPGPMMASVSEALLGAGVNHDRIRTESFGPSSLTFGAPPNPIEARSEKLSEKTSEKKEILIDFARSGKKIQWNNSARTLLQLAEQNGVEISSGCLYGDCGTCMTPLLSGEVEYLHPTGVTVDDGACLPCSCKPKTSLILDA